MKIMNSGFRRIFAVALLLLLCAGVNAQVLRTGYFTEGNVTRYRLNPALMSTRGHVSIPVLGNINIDAMGNVGMGNFLYDSHLNNDKLVTFCKSKRDV